MREGAQHTPAGWLTTVQNERESVKIGTSSCGGVKGWVGEAKAVLMRETIIRRPTHLTRLVLLCCYEALRNTIVK